METLNRKIIYRGAGELALRVCFGNTPGFTVAQIAPLAELIADIDLVGPELGRVPCRYQSDTEVFMVVLEEKLKEGGAKENEAHVSHCNPSEGIVELTIALGHYSSDSFEFIPKLNKIMDIVDSARDEFKRIVEAQKTLHENKFILRTIGIHGA